MIWLKAVKRFLGAYSVNSDRAGCIDDYLIGALGTGQTCLDTYGLVICKIKVTVRSSGDKFHMGALRIRKKRLCKSTANRPARAYYQRLVLARGEKRATFNHAS